MDELRTPAVMEFWAEFCRRTGVDPEQRWDAYAFGDTAAMADELAGLVVTGPKRATAGLYRHFEPPAGEPMPKVGAFSVILGGAGQPLAVVRTTDVAVRPLDEVDAQFAWDEGEGDRSLEYWLSAHRAFFARDLAADGLTLTDDTLVVLERFELVWPAGVPGG